MKKLLYTALGLMGIMGTLSMGVVNAQETCGSGYVENAAGTGCELIQVTFDANGGEFSGGETVKSVDTTVVDIPETRYSHTANINDNGVASSVYANNLSTTDVVTITGATSLDIEVRFATQSATTDWLAIYPAGITPSASNYSSATISNGKLAGRGNYTSYTKPSDSDTTYHRKFTASGDTAQFYFESNGSSAYYGYYAIVKGIGTIADYGCEYDIQNPVREGYTFGGWYLDEDFTQSFSLSNCVSGNITVYAKWYEINPKDIVIEATATATNQTLTINKYFANNYTINWGDGSIETLTADTTHTYDAARTYTIVLSLTGGADRWTFQKVTKPLVPINGTNMIGVKIVSMPSLADGFGSGSMSVGDCFFYYFNYNGALTSLPEGSFDTSNITTARKYFFSNFNDNGALTSLPEGSFDTSNISGSVGTSFFSYFNQKGKLTSLPANSFDISNITTIGDYFFADFNYSGALTSLPAGSFRLGSGLTTVDSYFFASFNAYGALTSLPEGSFDTSNISGSKGGYAFFDSFNQNGALTSLPEGSFRLTKRSNYTTIRFFSSFNSRGALTSLPEGSFDISNITEVRANFFSFFNCDGALTSLPAGSFDTSNISGTANEYFFDSFNRNGALTSLPEGSFRLSTGLTKVGNEFFDSFNQNGALTSLPTGSFNTENITSGGNYFFSNFNYSGALTSLPEGSFRLSTGSTKVGSYFFYRFNRTGALTSLPEGSFNTENITKVGDYFFNYFNAEGQLISLPEKSFDISNITSGGRYFFEYFNSDGALTSLPAGSFRLATGLTTVGDYFFAYFNHSGQLTSLPEGSFNTENITTVGYGLFASFNRSGSLTSLPAGSFRLATGLTTGGGGFFSNFNNNGALTSLPEGSFNTENITTVGDTFFGYFNHSGQLTSLPEGSFNTENITKVGDTFFAYFNYSGALTSLPDSFKLSSYAYNKSQGYQNAFNSPNYTINRKVSDLVSGVIAPSRDMNTFSDNQPGRCGVYPNWLVSTANACSISYDDGQGGTGEFKYTADTTGVVVGSGMEEPTRIGYTFSGWKDASGNKVEEIVFPDMDGQILNANREINQYTITLDIDGTLTVITGDYGSPVNKPTDPKKDGYTFKGWEPEIPDTMPAEDMTVKAKWERNGSSGGGGGGGGGGNSSSSSTGSNATTGSDNSNITGNQQTGSGVNNSTGTQNDQATTGTNIKEPENGTGSNVQTGSQADSQQAEQTSEQAPQNESNVQDSPANAPEGQNYSQEFQQAYEFAHENGITTMPTIQQAQMDGKLTRIAMAKMLSQYAMNILGQKPENIAVPKFNDVTEKMDSDYDEGVTLAYQLGIMGQNMPNNKFRPNDEVTRAEFATALSRMIYKTSDGEYKGTGKYYIHHMEKLVKEGIITKDDPNMKELRGYVMIMLMRSAK